MAILGVTDRASLDPRFKVIGKLRKGGPKQSNRPGQDLEYFRFTSDSEEAIRVFYEAYGGKPDSLEVYFPYDDYETVFPTARELYGQNHLLKEQCDGMHIIQWQEGPRMRRGKSLCEKKCKDTESTPPCPDCPLKPIGRLSVILLPLLRAGIVGTVTLETHGWHDVSHLATQLSMYEPLKGRAFRVYREKTRVGTPVKNKRVATDKWLVRIEPTQETAIMLIGDAQRRARLELTGGTDIPQLEAGQPLTPDMVAEETPDLDFNGDGGVEAEYVTEGDDFITESDIPFDVHWIDDSYVDSQTGEVVKIKDRFWGWTESIGLTASDVYIALGVQDIHQYEGDMKAARTQIEQYKTAHPLPAEATEGENKQ